MDREAGGQDAARQLKSAVLEYVRNVQDGAVGFDVRIVVRVYANFKGLGKTYQGAKILENANDLYLFARGFNMGDQLCDFIDAGDGKECSDVKIGGKFAQIPSVWALRYSNHVRTLEHFKSDVSNVHCKHIIFGGPADNGYARLLSPYSGDAAVSKRITMVEGPPFAFELRSLAEKFQTTSFTSIFRKTKLPTRKVSFSETPPTSPALTYASAAAVTGNSASNGSKSPRMSPVPAGAVLAPLTSPPVQLEQHQYQYPYQHQKKQLMMPVYQNNKGERVDMPLKPVEGIIKLLKQRRLCYQYHLLGDCGYNTCTHGHGTRLSSARELEALRFMARLSPCGIGLGCDLETCVAGHQCPRPGCQGGDCRFPREMHGVDKRIHN